MNPFWNRFLYVKMVNLIPWGLEPRLGRFWGVVMFWPCLFCPSDNFETCLALPTQWHALVRALSYWYLFCDPRRWDNSRKVCAPEARQHVGSAKRCHLDETNMDITTVHQTGWYVGSILQIYKWLPVDIEHGEAKVGLGPLGRHDDEMRTADVMTLGPTWNRSSGYGARQTFGTCANFQGTVSWELRWVLLYINWKLFSRDDVIYHEILILLRGHFTIPLSVWITSLKGQSHEIFCTWFFPPNSSSWSH